MEAIQDSEVTEREAEEYEDDDDDDDDDDVFTIKKQSTNMGKKIAHKKTEKVWSDRITRGRL